jgi:putative ABC transport system permease protein
MRLHHAVPNRIRLLFRRGRAGAQLDEELQFHLHRQIAENIAAGMSADEARYAALRMFGNPGLLREQTRATWSWNWLESAARDLRYSVRTLARTPGFAVIAILIIALGIGANVALFTLVRSVLLSPLPYRDPDRLVSIYENESQNHSDNRTAYLPVDAGSFFEWQRATQGAAELALISPWQEYNVSAEGGKLPEKIDAARCSWNLFSTLGVTPALGRDFSAADDSPGSAATVILTDDFWKRRYGGDSSIVGKTVWLNAKPYTVIGVLPPTFTYASAFGGNALKAWTPVHHEAPPSLLRDFGDHEFLVVARLLGGATLEGLVSRLDALQKHIHSTRAEPTVHDSVTGRTMLDDVVHNYKTPLYALLAATGCVMLIACMNVASLLVARTAARRRELAIRTALGGGWLRLMRERLVESVILCAAGGGLGLLLAWGALQWLVHTRQDMHRIESIHMDWMVFAFASGIILLCAVFAGLVTAFSAMGKDILGSLHEASRAHSGGRARAGLRRTLLVLEAGLTVVLLVGAGLLLKSYQRLRSTDLGVPTDNVLTMYFTLPEARYKEPVQQVAFFETLIGRLRALPGVQSAGLVSIAPGEGWGGDHMMYVVEHRRPSKGGGVDLMVRGADPGYFTAIGLPLLRGRIFTTDERLDRAHVAVISELAAKQLFPGEDPIGKHLTDSLERQVTEVIGVVSDTRWYVSEDPMPMLYWPIYGNDYSIATIVIRSTHDVHALALPVEKAIGQLDHDLPVSNVLTLREAIGESTVDSQFDSLLVLAFAVIALVLAGAGLYGVLTYLVTQRTGEIGIRIALGAKREQVLGKVMLDGLWPALIGLGFGLAGSAASVQLIRSMLYQTEPFDPYVFAAVAAILLAFAALACIEPAWRASRLDPMQALRTE